MQLSEKERILQRRGERVKMLRDRCGWTQEELAAKVPCSVRTIVRIEGGRSHGSPLVYERILAALGVPEGKGGRA